MTDQQTPKSRARRLIKNHIGTAGHTLEELFVEIAQEIEEAENRGPATKVSKVSAFDKPLASMNMQDISDVFGERN